MDGQAGLGLADKVCFGDVDMKARRGHLPVDADLDSHCAVGFMCGMNSS